MPAGSCGCARGATSRRTKPNPRRRAMLTNRTTVALAAPFLILAGAVPATRAGQDAPAYRRTSLVRLEARVDLKSPPAKVWAALTGAGGYAALTGFKITEADKRLAKVGDSVAA